MNPAVSNQFPQNHIGVESLLKKAAAFGVDFGSGSRTERLRYLVKLRLIDHPVRVKDPNVIAKRGEPPRLVGMYSTNTLARLVAIDRLVKSGRKLRFLTRDEVDEYVSRLRATNPVLEQEAPIVEVSEVEQSVLPVSKSGHEIPKQQAAVLWSKIGVTDGETEKRMAAFEQKFDARVDGLEAKVTEVVQSTSAAGTGISITESDIAVMTNYQPKLQKTNNVFEVSSKLQSDIVFGQVSKGYPWGKVIPVVFVSGLLVAFVYSWNSLPNLKLLNDKRLKTNAESQILTAEIEGNNSLLSSVLAASSEANSLYIDATVEIKGETTFLDDITAPNVVYGVTGGTGISVTAGQNPVVSLSATGIVTSVNTSSGALTVKGSGATTVTTSGSTITITSTDSTGTSGITAEVDTLATVTGRGATTSTAVTFSGGLTYATGITSSATAGVFNLADSGTLAFKDSTNTLATVVDNGAYGFIRLSDKGSTGDPSTCTAGDIYFNDTDNSFKGCITTDTWEAFDASGAAPAWSAITDPTGSLSLTFGDGEVNTFTVSSDTEDFWTFTASSITTGSLLVATGSTTTGVTDHFIKVSSDVGSGAALFYGAPDFSGSGVTGYGLNITGTDITTAGNTNYGVYSSISAGGEATSGTRNLYAIYVLASGDVSAGGTINSYGVYVASGTYDTEGTNTAVGLYLEPIAGADSNYGICFDCDGTWTSSTVASGIQFGTDANAVNLYRGASDVLYTDDAFSVAQYIYLRATDNNIKATGTNGKLGLFSTGTGEVYFQYNEGTGGVIFYGGDTTADVTIASPTTTGTLISASYTSFTTGEILDITGTFAPASGTNEAIDINITHAPTDANTFSAIDLVLTDATTQSSTIYGIATTLTLTGNAQKDAYGIKSDLTSNSTTGNEGLTGGLFTPEATGALTSGNRNVYGLYSDPFAGAESVAGITSVYGLYTVAGGDVSTGGTFNAYGVYVANGTYDTEGTSTAYGLYVAAISGADTNYGAYINSGTASSALTIVGTNTTNDVMTITATALTTGSALVITGGSSTPNADALVKLTTDVDNTGSALKVTADFSNADGGSTAYGVYVDSTNSVAATATNFGVYSTMALTNDAAKSGVAFRSNVTSSSTTGDTLIGFDSRGSVTGAISTGSRNQYGFYTAVANTATNTGGTTNVLGFSGNPSYSASADVSGSTVNVFGFRTQNTALLNTGGTINSYGFYAANANTMNTVGTSTQYGLYVEAQTGADTNYEAIFAGTGGVGIGDTTPNATLDIDSSATTTNDFGITNTSYTTGEAIDVTGTWTPASGSRAIDINITYSPTADDFTFAGLDINLANATTNGQFDVGIVSTVARTGDKDGTARAFQSSVTSTSTTADILVGYYATSTVSGAISTGNRSIYGLQSVPATTAVNTGGTTYLYGVVGTPSASGADTGSTTNVYGLYAGNTASVSAGTINSYGVLIANGTMNTVGTSTQYGLYIADQTGADNNVGALINDDVLIGNVTVPPQLAGGDSLFIFNNNGDANNFFRLDAASDNLYFVGRSHTGSGAGTGFIWRTAAAGGGETDRMVLNSTGNLAITSVNVSGTGTSSAFSLAANSVTTGNAASISSTAMTTGEALDITGTWTTTDGTTNEAIDINLTYTDTTAGGRLYGIDIALADSSTVGTLERGVSSVVTLTNNAAKNANAYVGAVDTSSTTADTIRGMSASTNATGALSSGTRSSSAFYDISTISAANSGGTHNHYGFLSNTTISGNNGGTVNYYGVYTGGVVGTPASHTVTSGTLNDYGVYVANTTTTTVGSTTKYGLYVEAQTGADANVGALINSPIYFSSTLTTGATGDYLCIVTSGNNTWEVTRSNGTTSCSTSSHRFKQDIADLNYGLNDVMNLRPVSFRYKPEMNKGDATHLGFIAEEVEGVMPELVAYDDQGLPSGVDYPVVTAVLVKAIQELDVKVEDQAAFINDNLASLTALNAQMLSQTPESYYDTNGNLDQSVADKILTASQIDEMVTQKFALKLEDLKDDGRLIPTATEVAEATNSAALAQQTQQTLDNLNALLAGTSATLEGLTVTGNTNLAQTMVAGTFSQDGTFIIDYGKQINVLGSTLFLQNDGLAGDQEGGVLVDIGAGKVTISDNGDIEVEGEVKAAKLNVGDKSAGVAKLLAGQATVVISTSKVTSASLVFLTPVVKTNSVLAVTSKLEGDSFTVEADSPVGGEVDFNWMIVN